MFDILRRLDPNGHLSRDEIFSDLNKGRDIRFISLQIIQQSYKALEDLTPFGQIFVSAKTITEPNILELVKKMGASIEVASEGELFLCLNRGIAPEKIMFAQKDAPSTLIRSAYSAGVRNFIVQSPEAIMAMSGQAPKANILIKVPQGGRMAHDDTVKMFMSTCRKMGMNPIGLSLSPDPSKDIISGLGEQIALASRIFKDASELGYELTTLDLGDIPSIDAVTDPSELYESYVRNIVNLMLEHFGEAPPANMIVKPADSLVRPAGVIMGHVTDVKKSEGEDSKQIITTTVSLLANLDTKTRFIRLHPGQKYEDLTEVITIPTEVYSKTRTVHDKALKESLMLPSGIQKGDIVIVMGVGAHLALRTMARRDDVEAPTTMTIPAASEDRWNRFQANANSVSKTNESKSA